MTLTQAQRDEIRYAFEDAGMPEVLAFMAGKVATHDMRWVFFSGRKYALASLSHWNRTPQGRDFWWAVEDNMENLK